MNYFTPEILKIILCLMGGVLLLQIIIFKFFEKQYKKRLKHQKIQFENDLIECFKHVKSDLEKVKNTQFKHELIMKNVANKHIFYDLCLALKDDKRKENSTKQLVLYKK